MKPAFHILTLLLLLSGPTWSQDQIAVNISTERIARDVFFLASDSLMGRQFPHQGRAIAAGYIASEFARIGLIPTSDNQSSYMQWIPVVVSDWGESHIKTGSSWIRSGSQFSFASTRPLVDTAHWPMRFIGQPPLPNRCFGDTIVHIAAKTMNDAMPILLSLSQRCQTKRFAISLTGRKRTTRNLIRQEVNARNHRYPQGVMGMGAREYSWLYSYLPADANEFSVMLLNEGTVDDIYGSTTRALLRAQRRADSPQADPTFTSDIGVKTSFSIDQNIKIDENVVGYLKGTDLKDEVVIICAHYDHIGSKDSLIYNGADDNASGTAALLELARMFAQAQANGVEFRRSIAFIAFGAEESGLNGSSYYVENPIFPLHKTALVINMDMVGRTDQNLGRGYAYTVPFKGNKRPMRRLIRSVGRQMDDIYFMTRMSGKSRFMWYFGSDHYPFVSNGVPALVVNTGLHDDYHQLTDTPEKIDYINMARIVRALFAVTTEVANEPERFPLVMD